MLYFREKITQYLYVFDGTARKGKLARLFDVKTGKTKMVTIRNLELRYQRDWKKT